MRAVDLDLLEIIENHDKISYGELLTICISNKMYNETELQNEINNMLDGGYIKIENEIIIFIKNGY
ncbi:hypothetical protein [Clostridioides difficile]|uniref:hypothetical protein n=1 Tax=Clostridioides difficile TaxID=1496 RepID=UPI000D1FCB81|nr:hypothetical protein [Clostridioides difficile]